MTDIVERLRGTIGAWLPTKLGWEAADEIERLRADIEQLTAERANRYWEGRWRDEKAENERLRALVNDKVEEIELQRKENAVKRVEIERLRADERERCAKVCDALAAACVFSQEDDERLAFRRAAAVIRKGE